jgi:hypothetical protein
LINPGISKPEKWVVAVLFAFIGFSMAMIVPLESSKVRIPFSIGAEETG